MKFSKWLKRDYLQKTEVTPDILDDLRRLIDRDFKDAQTESLSCDRRYATAYGAALNLVSYLIRKEGYKVVGKRGHHQVTFEIAKEILDEKNEKMIDYFNKCRRKRNKIDYDNADVVTEDEVKELIQAVGDFKKIVLKD